MIDLLEALRRASAPDRTTYRPEFFRLDRVSDHARLEELLMLDPHIVVHDVLDDQLSELVRGMHPSKQLCKEELDHLVNEHVGKAPRAAYGVWVHYPWSSRLVHLLDEVEFSKVRTDRNRNKITSEEQAVLSRKRVGVIGLSVGQSVSLTMAMERSFGEIRLADFDTLELSNLNRIRSGVHELGLPKIINTAREIAEIDPFLKVTVFPEGITPENIERFLTDGGRLDVLIEECDSVDIKILARQRAKAHGIPVVMDTSDRGMIDVERFDLEPERPIMHGSIDHLDLDAAGKARTAEEKLPFILPIAGVADLSKRMKATMLEIGNSVTSWPQLGSSVCLGGGLGADVYRRIALGTPTLSGRWFVDAESVGTTPPAPLRKSVTPEIKEKPEPDILLDDLVDLVRHAPSSPSVPGGLTVGEAREICLAGSLAPSAGNLQPWRFLLHHGRIHLFHAACERTGVFDDGGAIRSLDMSACLENMIIKAAAMGIPLDVETFPVAGKAFYTAVIGRRAGIPGPDDGLLEPSIVTRCTNRKEYDGHPIPEQVIEHLTRSVGSITGCALHLAQGNADLNAIADIVGEAERIRLLNPIGHHELFSKEIRWDRNDPRGLADGLDLDTFEMDLGSRLGLSIAADPDAIGLLRAWNAGQGFKEISGRGIRSSSAVALVTTADAHARSFFQGGRAVQRMWLTADLHGLAAHPVGAPILLSHHVRHGKAQGLNAQEVRMILELHERLMSLFGTEHREPVFMLRIGYAPPPTAVAQRRPLASMFNVTERPLTAAWNG